MSGRVLVVDDNEDNLRIIQEILRTRGFTVRLARDGTSALNVAIEAAVTSEDLDAIDLQAGWQLS